MKVFVYGTLLRGESNHRTLDGARFVGREKTRPDYRLLDLGAYPAIVADGSTSVVGEVYEVNAAGLARLDRLEGHPTMYLRTPVVLAGGTEAFVYVMRERPTWRRNAPTITSGDWRRRK